MLLLLHFLTFFLTFLQNPKKRDFLRFFAVFHTFSRTMVSIGRVWGLPFNAHSVFLPLLGCHLLLHDKLMKRLLTFTQKCINCDNNLVRFVARYAVWYGMVVWHLHSDAAYFSVALGTTLSMRILCH